MGLRGNALEFPFEPVGLTAPIARLARPFACVAPPFALTEPGGDPADNETESEGPKQKEKEGRLERKAGLASAERIKNEERGLAIDDGKRDEGDTEGNDDKGKDELTPH